MAGAGALCGADPQVPLGSSFDAGSGPKSGSDFRNLDGSRSGQAAPANSVRVKPGPSVVVPLVWRAGLQPEAPAG